MDWGRIERIKHGLREDWELTEGELRDDLEWIEGELREDWSRLRKYWGGIKSELKEVLRRD